MNIVEKEAKYFIKNLYADSGFNLLEDLKIKVSVKLSDFYRDRDKLDFLKTLKVATIEEKEKYLLKCKKKDCDFIVDRTLGLFVIDQEIEEINKYYKFEAKSEDAFTSEEESKIHAKLNEIIDQLNKQGLGQEIIFDEIESLKNHFNLGKKTWFQLLKGKLIDLTIEKVLEKTIVTGIYDSITAGYKNVVHLLE